MKENSTETNGVKGKAFSTKSLVLMALFAAILCVSAYISIPIPVAGAPHITLLNFMILLIAVVFPVHQSFLIVLVWMLLGMLGLPVFIGGASGVGYLITPWGGYTVSFILIAILLPLVRGKKYKRIRYTIMTVAAALLIDILGMIWLMVNNGLSLKAGILTGFVPFLPLDVIKAVVAAQLAPVFIKILNKN